MPEKDAIQAINVTVSWEPVAEFFDNLADWLKELEGSARSKAEQIRESGEGNG